MQAFGVFGLCQIHAFVDYVRARMPKEHFQLLFKSVVLVAAVGVSTVGGILTFTGKISPWTGRFYSLLDPSYAKNNIPIIASVSEHQPTTWSSFYFDLQLMVFMFPVGLYYCFFKLTDANIFIIMYGVTSIYFAVSGDILTRTIRYLDIFVISLSVRNHRCMSIWYCSCNSSSLKFHWIHPACEQYGQTFLWVCLSRFVSLLNFHCFSLSFSQYPLCFILVFFFRELWFV